ncbi:chemotaxis protein CheB [Gracilimonas sp. Q87]|uniref:chemotaxis protein CheB n=1 Tax=Gracilimonas sp. Q87 TaxID=3384766 RepID=UPI003983E5BA
MKTIDLILLENSTTVQDRIKSAVNKSQGIKLEALFNFEDPDEIKKHLKESEPDVLLVGIDERDSEQMKLFKYIRKHHSSLPILVLTPHSREGAATAIKALKNGAVEFFPKTSKLSGSILTEDFFKKRVIPVIKVAPRLNRSVLVTQQFVDTSIKKMKQIPADFFENSLSKMDVLVLAGCLGGIAPLYLLLSSFPANLPVPILVVQHMVEDYSKELAADLNQYTALQVKEAEDGEEMQAGWVYLAPGDYHIQTKKKNGSNYISLNHGPKVEGFRPSIDVLLKSTARQFGKNALTVYLSGGGNDGIEGAKVIDIVGGQIIIQNERTSLLSDISWKVGAHGIGDGSYPLERLSQEISQRII